ncbi:MAG: AbrB/MazE/SpoVT family DNA-binding domain-containing protein [Planctomycetota bacterium]
MRITSKGQVTIPVEIRRKAGLLPDTEVDFVLEGNQVLLRKSASDGRRGRTLVEHLSRARTLRMSTDEIMRLTRGD